MTVQNVIDEYKTEVRRLRIERDVIREKLIDQVQWTRNIDREKATALVDLEIFQALQGAA